MATGMAAWRTRGTAVAAVLLCVYTLAEVLLLYLPPLAELAVFLTLCLSVAFLHAPSGGRPWLAAVDVLAIVLAALTGGYIVVEHDALMIRMGAPSTLDVAMGTVGTLLVLEAARRTIGWILPALGCVAFAYAMLGEFIPIDLGGHSGFRFARVITDIYMTEQGIYGPALGIMFSLVTLFVILGMLLTVTGGTRFIIDFARSLFGRYSGGPAKVAVVASGMFGSISGSAVANVMVTGCVTIPMMKKSGLRDHVAAGVEAAASTGGQLMPPIMGSAAFMMIQFVDTSYLGIIKAALLPAILYYLALFAAVHFYARRHGLKGVAPERTVSVAEFFARGAVFFLPLAVVVVALYYRSPRVAVLYAMATLVVVSSLRAESRLNLRKLLDALRQAGIDAAPTVCAAASVGVVIAMVMLTGLGLRLPNLILNLGGNSLPAVLVLVMFTSLLLGMGLPTVVCYLLLATMMAPALVNLGVGVMAAHLFILYFGCLSMVTPPVALAAYAAGAIGGANLMQTGFSAWKLALSGFIIPFMFVYGPPLLMQGTFLEIAAALLSSVTGVVVLGAAVMGYFIVALRAWEWVALMLAALLMINVGWATDLAGASLVAAVAVVQWKRRSNVRVAPDTESGKPLAKPEQAVRN